MGQHLRMKERLLLLAREYELPHYVGILSKGALAVFLVNLFAVVIGFTTQVIIARSLGPGSYGTYEYAIAWLSILVLPCARGLDHALVRYVAQYQSQRSFGLLKGVLQWGTRQCFRSSIFITLGLLVILTLVRPYVPSIELVGTLMFGAALLPIWALNNLRQAALKGFRHVVSARAPDVILRPLLLALLVLGANALSIEPSAHIPMLCHLMAATIVLVVGGILLERAKPEALRQAAREETPREWHEVSLSLMYVGALFIVVNEVDKLLVGLFLPPSSVGLYVAAVRLTSFVIFAAEAVNTIAAPLISEIYAVKDQHKLQQMVSYAAVGTFAASLPILIGLVLFGRSLLSLNGPAFGAAYPVLLILTLGQTVAALLGPWAFLLLMTGNQRATLRTLLISVLLLATLNPLAIYLFGLPGAALVTVLVLCFRNVTLWHKARRLVEVDASVLFALRRFWNLFHAKESGHV